MFFHPEPLKEYCPYSFATQVFSKEECEAITVFCKQSAPQQSLTGGGLQLDIRKSKQTFLPYNESSSWIFERLKHYASNHNERFWKFRLSGFTEGFQFTNYGKGSFYGWHQDSGHGPFSIRKLSLVVQLTDPSKYTGGRLEFGGASNTDIPIDQGSVVFFPSYNPHRVTEVLSGTRNSLVAWISGPPYT